MCHGDLFEFFRNHRFNATNPFAAVDPATGKRRDDGLNRNQFGGTLGGPIKTDKLFFFGAYQGTQTTRDGRPTTSRFVPTPRCWRATSPPSRRPPCNTRGAGHAARAVRQQPDQSGAVQSGGAGQIARSCR